MLTLSNEPSHPQGSTKIREFDPLIGSPQSSPRAPALLLPTALFAPSLLLHDPHLLKPPRPVPNRSPHGLLNPIRVSSPTFPETLMKITKIHVLLGIVALIVAARLILVPLSKSYFSDEAAVQRAEN